MDKYDFLSKVTNWALWLLGISFGLAVIDNIYFDEAYRSTIGIVGIIALCAFLLELLLLSSKVQKIKAVNKRSRRN